MISVIVPVYNVKYALLKRCIYSILKQDVEGMEILIVLNGCSKEYITNVTEIFGEDCCIIVAKKKGVSHARNIGLKYAKGEYIAFVDADDELMDTFFSEALLLCEENDLDIVSGSINFVYKKKIKKMKPSFDGMRVYFADELKKYLLWQEEGRKYELEGYYLSSPCAKLFRRRVIDNILFNEKIYHKEDLVYVYKVLLKSTRVGVTSSEWYNYYQYTSSALHSYDNRIVKNDYNIIKELDRCERHMYKEKMFYFFELINEMALYSSYSEFKKYMILLKKNTKTLWNKCENKELLINKVLYIKYNLLYRKCFVFLYLYFKIINIWKKEDEASLFLGECIDE